MKKLSILLIVLFISLTGKAITKTELAEELVYKNRAYTWFMKEYRRGILKIYGKSTITSKIVSDELAKNRKEIKKRLVTFYSQKLTKGELFALTMPLSLLKKKDMARIKKLRSTVNFLNENSDIANVIVTPLISKLDLHRWAGTDKMAALTVRAEEILTMK